MSIELRRYYILYVLHTTMRESEKQGINKKGTKTNGIICTVSDNKLTRRTYTLNDNFDNST